MEQYILPSGNKIDIDGVIEAFDGVEEDCVYLLDLEKGDVGCIENSPGKTNKSPKKGKAEEMIKSGRYVAIPPLPQKEKLKIARDFLEMMSVDPEDEDKEVIEVVSKILNGKWKDKSYLIEEIIYSSETGIEIAWETFRDDVLWEKACDWFDTLPVEVEVEFKGCGNCPACKLFGSNPTEEEVKEVFEEMNKSTVAFGEEEMLALKGPDEEIMDNYYNAMELAGGNRSDRKRAEKLLQNSIKLDPNNVITYVGLVHLYYESGDKDKEVENVKIAYEKTKQKFPKWPTEMPWGVLRNRPFLRAIKYRAGLHAEEGKEKEAIKLYKQILKMNPSDNQGVRYLVAGLYAGISGEEIDTMVDEGNEKQDWDKVENLLKEQNKKHKFWKEPKWD
ncbi:MAG: hypothetical protein COV70_02335 [Parcubacteria group bacterium CG11_big_fil_rev_8_21_14_0_20_39_22]|nr:MAG: hypothetical protein COV70_02335 [Parcubacteria group bacterium CG11_big_fil_rev_8_21_14_0_20_39_22]